MRAPPKPGLLLVATRELRWMRRDGVALVLALVVPVLAFAILTLTFSNAVIRNLRVAIVDADRSATSLIYVQSIASAPGVRVAERSSDMRGAMQAVRSGDAIAAVYIPENFERDLLARKRPQVVSLYNRQYFTPGNNADSAISSAISAATAALPREADGGGYRPGALVAEQYVLSNPALNFAQFLLRAVLPTVLHVVTAIAGGYAVGSEFSRRSKRAWMRAAGGRPLVALMGKLMPLFGIFIVMMVVDAAIIHDALRRALPRRSVARRRVRLSSPHRLSLLRSVTGSADSGAADRLEPDRDILQSGLRLRRRRVPGTAMGTFPQAWGSILPLRWYLQILFDQAARGVPTSIRQAVPHSCRALPASISSSPGLRLRAIANAPPKREPGLLMRLRYGRRVAIAMGNEVQRILGDRSVLGLIVLAPLAYGALYPQPYLGQVLREHTDRRCRPGSNGTQPRPRAGSESDEAIAVKVRSDTLADAQAALDRHEVFAILAIPKDTERYVLRGQQARIAAYVDAAYFLLYSRTLQGISEAASTVSADIASAARAAREASPTRRWPAAPRRSISSPNRCSIQPAATPAMSCPPPSSSFFNRRCCSASRRLAGRPTRSAAVRAAGFDRGARAVFGQALAHLCFALPGLALYLIVLPRVYGFSTLGRLEDLILMAVPFVLSVSFLAQFVSAWFTRRETAILIFIAVSLPLFFQVGVSWPVEALPDFIRAASRIIPSTSAIDGFVRINQMGASILEVRRDWTICGF